MPYLFEIETSEVLFKWSTRSSEPPPADAGLPSAVGRLAITDVRDPSTSRCSRAGLPHPFSTNLAFQDGPRLYEQTDYSVYARSKSGKTVELLHRDPTLCKDLRQEDGGTVLHGVLNFRSDIGYSDFELRSNGRVEFRFQVEVFPTKLDYRSDYDEMMAEVQDQLYGLALEYLRRTHQGGATYPQVKTSSLEWLSLLRNLIAEVEAALHYISRRPIHGLTREPVPIAISRMRRVSSTVRSAVRHGSGYGQLVPFGKGQALVRERIDESRARPTLDTAEHRWLANQVRTALRRLASIRAAELERPRASERRKQVVGELDGFTARLLRLIRLEPLRTATGSAPPGFTSLQLHTAPGYREASRSCLALSLGLRVEGGPLSLSVKSLDLLYEYWSYLTVVQLVASECVGHSGSSLPQAPR